MIIDLFNFTKKTNSTKQPTGLEPCILDDVILKENCSLTSPIIVINPNFLTRPTQYNYCRIQEFGRYYFITEWVFDGALWEAHLKVDTLLSFRTSILDTQLYVLRSASKYDLNIVDTLYPATCNLTRRTGDSEASTENSLSMTNPDWGSATMQSPYGRRINEGYFYVKILNNQANLGYCLYVFTYTEYKNFIHDIYNMSFDIEGITADLAKILVNPMQYIISVKWCPYLIPGGMINPRSIKVGFGYTLPNTYNCADVTNYTGFDCYDEVALPKHPSSDRGKWANLTSFTRYTLSFYPFGKIELNGSDLVKSTSIGLIWSIDIRTGKAILRITANVTGVIIYETVAEYMVEIPVVQTSTTIYGAVGQMMTNIYPLTSSTSNNELSPLQLPPYQRYNAETIDLTTGSTSLSNIGSALASYGSKLSSIGSFDMLYSFYLGTPYIEAVFKEIAEEDLSHAGRPLCQDVVLNTLSGYCQCRDGDIEITGATTEERSEIGNYLVSGFFIE